MRRGQFYHLTRAHKEHVRIGDRGENAFRKAHGRRRHRYRLGAYGCLRAHFFGDRERTLEKLVQVSSHGAGILRASGRLLHLAEDLRFADHHRIQACGDTKRVPHCLLMTESVQMWLEDPGIDAVKISQPARRVCHNFDAMLARAIDLGAIAGRQDRGLAGEPAINEFLERHVHALDMKHDLLAQMHGRRMMIQSESGKLHGLQRREAAPDGRRPNRPDYKARRSRGPAPGAPCPLRQQPAGATA